jgi:hypothetical protein
MKNVFQSGEEEQSSPESYSDVRKLRTVKVLIPGLHFKNNNYATKALGCEGTSP